MSRRHKSLMTELVARQIRDEARRLMTPALKNGEQRSGVRHLLAEDSDFEIRFDVCLSIASDINTSAAFVVFTEVRIDRAKQAMARSLTDNYYGDGDRIRLLGSDKL